MKMTPNNLKSVVVGDLVDLNYIPTDTFSRAMVTEVTDKGFTCHRPFCHVDNYEPGTINHVEIGAEECYFNWTDSVLKEVHKVVS